MELLQPLTIDELQYYKDIQKKNKKKKKKPLSNYLLEKILVNFKLLFHGYFCLDIFYTFISFTSFLMAFFNGIFLKFNSFMDWKFDFFFNLSFGSYNQKISPLI